MNRSIRKIRIRDHYPGLYKNAVKQAGASAHLKFLSRIRATKPVTVARRLGYIVRSKPWPIEKPIVLQFPVIDICNSRCQMCNIWKNKKADVISADQLSRVLESDLFSDVLAVGLNGGEPTLRKDLVDIAETVVDRLPKLRTLSVITNSYKLEDVKTRLSELHALVDRTDDVDLDVMLSLDGVGGVHDRVRGRDGNFRRVDETLDFLRNELNLDKIRLGCTIIRENVFGLRDLHDYALKRDVYIKYRLGIPHQRLYTTNLTTPYALSVDETLHVCEFLQGVIRHYETQGNQKDFYESLIGQMLYGHPRKAGCDWQHRGVTLTSKGDILYCAVESDTLGSAITEDPKALYFGHDAHRRDIVQTKCDECHHDYMGLPDGEVMLNRLRSRFKRKIKRSVIRTAPALGDVAESQIIRARLRRRRKELATTLNPIDRLHEDTKEDTKNVLICGWYGTETKGDQAILAGLVDVITSIDPTTRVYLQSLNRYISEKSVRDMPELNDLVILSQKEAYAHVTQMDLVLFGGGPIMAIDEMQDMTSLFRKARVHDVPTMIGGCGVGPFGHKAHNTLIKELIDLSDIQIYRDEDSQSLARRTPGVTPDNTETKVCLDPAFLWASAQSQTLRANDPRNNVKSAKTIVLGLRRFPPEYAFGEPVNVMATWQDQFDRNLKDSLGHLRNATDAPLRIVPLPMCTNHFGSDDRWYYRDLFRSFEMPEAVIDYSFLGEERPVDAYMQTFMQADLVISMRYHSLIFALTAEAPVISIDYTLGKGKVASLSKSYAVPSYQFADLAWSEFNQKAQTLLEAGRQSPHLNETHARLRDDIRNTRRTLLNEIARIL